VDMTNYIGDFGGLSRSHFGGIAEKWLGYYWTKQVFCWFSTDTGGSKDHNIVMEDRTLRPWKPWKTDL
jgi:hypothetical protein